MWSLSTPARAGGLIDRPPFPHRVTAVIPHRDTPDLLRLCIRFLERQTERPYIMVIDTGSRDDLLHGVLAMRSETTEIHQIACHGPDQIVASISHALDLGLSACRTDWMWCLHSDCFVTDRHMLEDMLALGGGGDFGAIGYRAPHGLSFGADGAGLLSSTCTLYHVPTLDRHEISWSIRRSERRAEGNGQPSFITPELAAHSRLRERGVATFFIADEQPQGVEIDAHRVHLRAATARRIGLARNDRDDRAILDRLADLAESGDGLLREQRAASNQRLAAPASAHDAPRAAERAPTVSILVTARNYARFLRECLQSCVSQSVEPIDVIYSDDASTDESVEIARSFPRVTVLAGRRHDGVCAARNRAVAASRGEVLIHVDGDDRLPPDFVARHVAALTPDTPFVYGPAQAFGEHSTLWSVQPWGERPIWEMNFCNTSSAIWRTVFDAAGGWRENPTGTFWDWDLFLRASRFGTPAPSTATLEYRQHGESWSHTHAAEAEWSSRVGVLGQVRRARVKLSIACIHSGRLPGLLKRWCNAIAANVSRAELSHRPDLTILDNSTDQADSLYRETGRLGALFSAVRILPHPARVKWSNETERRNAVATFMAEASNRVLDETRGELVWLVEDDVIPPPLALRQLLTTITEGYPLRAAVSALYRNRHDDVGWIAGHWDRDSPRNMREPFYDGGVMTVDFAGTGCLLFWRALAPDRFAPFLATTKHGLIASHDWAFTDAMSRSGRKVVMLTDIRCRHYKAEGDWV